VARLLPYVPKRASTGLQQNSHGCCPAALNEKAGEQLAPLKKLRVFL
jgi:hypothetical protein